MTKDDAIRFFGTQEALGRALGIGQPAISEWGVHPPELRQVQLHGLTRGRLPAEPDVIEKYHLPAFQPAAADGLTPA